MPNILGPLVYWSNEIGRDFFEPTPNFDRAIRLDGAKVEFRLSQGKVHLALKNWPQALADFDRALTLDPENAVAFEQEGRVHIERGEVRRAITDLDRAIALDPKSCRALFLPGPSAPA